MMNEYQQTLKMVNSLQQTENGATGFSTTGNNLVDLNFTVPSNHDNVKEEDIKKFIQVLNEDLVTGVKWMFYLRDVREGLGERDSFVSFFWALNAYNQEAALAVLPLIPEYGRWKDVIDILAGMDDSSPLAEHIYALIESQLKSDLSNMAANKSVSLLAKWLPSVNASKYSRALARRISNHLVLTFENYRKMLSALRQYIDVTEVKTCGDNWKEIDYNKVSSNANARYVKAFMKHDPERRQKYLDALSSPVPVGAVMHAANLYPYEVYSKYTKYVCYSIGVAVEDQGVEALWKNLKDIPSVGNTMVVVDGSGSMEQNIKGSKVMAIDIARSLGVYFSERCTGEFKDKVIEFSATPRFIDLTGCKSLADKYNVLREYTDCSNTNLEKVFDLLLMTAINNKMSQDDLPKRILVVSDMEFDGATSIRGYNQHLYVMEQYKTLFQTIKDRWTAAGYTMPEIVFWNVNSRTQTIPVTSNEAGVILVSGFSVNNVNMILSGEIDPWKALKSVLDSERYQPIGEILAEEGK